MSGWSKNDIPDQTGRLALVTGANSGIGQEAAAQLAFKGAHVVLACRSAAKARDAMREIEAAAPAGVKPSLEFLALDLSSLNSVREAASTFRSKHKHLDMLINNAGVMWLPHTLSADGHEMQFATNHLGHFALTLLLLDTLNATPGARVVTVSSLAHTMGRIHFDDLSFQHKPYSRLAAYGQSKVANLLFMQELSTRLKASGATTASIACHPGVSNTNLSVPGFAHSRLLSVISRIGTALIGQPAATGALPTLYAATSPHAKDGDYIGPSGFRQARGAPRHVGRNRYSRDPDVAHRLWVLSEQLASVAFPSAH